jgi:hypothetical protein
MTDRILSGSNQIVYGEGQRCAFCVRLHGMKGCMSGTIQCMGRLTMTLQKHHGREQGVAWNTCNVDREVKWLYQVMNWPRGGTCRA